MMRNFRILNAAFIVVLICCLVFPVAPAAADTPEVDLASSPYVIYPKDEDIFTTTPKFRFTKFPGVTKYRIDVWNGDDLDQPPLYTVKFSPDCNADECWYKPAIALKKYDLSGEKGEYTWRIRAKEGTEWPPLWSQTTFRVLSSGFNSQFTVDYAKWTPLFGDWNVTSAGYLKGNGPGDNYFSIVQKHLVTTGYVYEVRMKRKLCKDTENTLYFNAYPYPTLWNRWDSGYMFEYYNNGRWRLGQRVGNVWTTLIPEADSDAIVEFGWNKLTIWSHPPYFHFWINEVYMGGYQLTTFEEGYVGIGMYMNASDEPLLVDWATLKYSDTAPYTIP